MNRLKEALDRMILSASGWRSVFSPDGENGTGKQPVDEHMLLTVAMGVCFGQWIKAELGKDCPSILVATDTRPTGPALAEMVMRGLESNGCAVVYPGIAAAPEAMARCGRDQSIDGFAYVSASHNPSGYNGLKFGSGGGVLDKGRSEQLSSQFIRLVSAEGAWESLSPIAWPGTKNPEPRHPDGHQKQLCLEHYQAFLEEIAGGCGPPASQKFLLGKLRESLQQKPLTVTADLNGSARCLSADRSWLESLGVKFIPFNDQPGQIAHAILPEGDALNDCRYALDRMHNNAPTALIGYVPDNDGDRGNLVIWDDLHNQSRSLEAQEVFAITVLAELATEFWTKNGAASKSAIVVNGPTSHRVRCIAQSYGVEVHESEVGEANVVNRATELRQQGYSVRFLGEGSNGGGITHPAQVRDPLNTLTALIKLIRLPAIENRQQPFEDWCRRIGKSQDFQPEFGPAHVLATIPDFVTTPASSPKAVVTIQTASQADLKTAWEKVFLHDWQVKRDQLNKKYGFVDWHEINNEGTQSRIGMGHAFRTGNHSGGLKIVFTDTDGLDAGFIWMRQSGTEPVFRIMAEIRGTDTQAEKELLEWQHRMVVEADRICQEHI